jgi:hypothetical protein
MDTDTTNKIQVAGALAGVFLLVLALLDFLINRWKYFKLVGHWLRKQRLRFKPDQTYVTLKIPPPTSVKPARSDATRAPKVHFVPDAHNNGWAGNEHRTDFRAGGIFTYDGPGALLVTKAFLEGTTPTTDMVVQVLTADGRGPTVTVRTLELRAHIPVRALITLWLTPLHATLGEPLRARLILRDNYNRDYEIAGVEWPWIGQKISKPAGT